jgi:hypothetical protein
MYDALAVALGNMTRLVFNESMSAPSSLPPTLVVSFAAHYTISYLYPDYVIRSRTTTVLTTILRTTNATSAISTMSQQVGQTVARAVIRDRLEDNAFVYAEDPTWGKCGDWDDAGAYGAANPRPALGSSFAKLFVVFN